MSPAQTEPIVESMNESSAPGDPFAPLAAAFLHIEDSAIVFSAEGELVVWNPGAERLYGYTFEEARRKDISFLAAPEESGATISLIARILSGQPVLSFSPKTGPLFLETEGGCDGSETLFG